MPTTFANTINGNEILAKRAECDYAGNDLQTTYATKSEVTTGLASKEDSANKAQTLDPSSSTEFPSSAATANYVNSSVATATANFLGNFTLAELGLTYPATDAQIGAALDAYTWPTGVTPTNNDYTYIEIENPQTTGIDDSVERFKFNGSNWVYEYTLNNSSFTAAEKAAIDSGIDSTKVTAYDSHVADTDIHVTLSDKTTWNGKQDAISDLATIRSGASAGATAVQPGDLATVATTGDYSDLLNKPDLSVYAESADLATVATTGAYSDLSGTPTIPTATSDLTNDSGFITLSDVPAQVNADWNASSGAAEILNKPSIPPALSAGNGIDITNNVVSADLDGTSLTNGANGLSVTLPVPDTTGASQGDVLSVGQNGIEWTTPSGGAKYFPDYYERIEQVATDNSMATVALGPSLTRNHLAYTFYQRALVRSSSNGIYVVGTGSVDGIRLIDFAGNGYVRLSRNDIYSDVAMYAIWFPCTSNSDGNLTVIDKDVYLKTKTTYTFASTNYSHYVYTSLGAPVSWTLNRDAVFPTPFNAKSEIDTTLFDKIGDWSSITLPLIWKWALSFQDNQGNFVSLGGHTEADTNLSVAYPKDYYNVKLLYNGGISENPGAGLYLTNPLPSSTASDADKVLTVDSQGVPGWASAQAPISAGDGIDITNNVVSAVVASPLAINTDDEIWLKTGRGLDTQAGLQSDELEVRLSGTGGLMYDSNDDDGLAIQLAQYSGLEVQMNNGVQEGLNVLVDGTTIDKNSSGELTVIGGGGGGTQADWTEDDPTDPSYIENKPTPKTLTGGTNITVTENSSTITISATWQNAQADWTESDPTQPAYIQHKPTLSTVATSGAYSDLSGTPTIPTVDQTYDGTSANAQSGVAVASGISDAVAALPTNLTTAQIQALKEALGVDETVLYSGMKTIGNDGVATYNLSESPLNFQYIKVYFCANDNTFGSAGNIGSSYTEWDTQIYTAPSTFLTVYMDGNASATAITKYAINCDVSGIQTSTWTAHGYLNDATGNAKWFHIFKIVGRHRIASNTPATPDPGSADEIG